MLAESNYWENPSPPPAPNPQAAALAKAKATLADPTADPIAKSVADAFIRQNTPYQAPAGYYGQPMPGPNNMLGVSKNALLTPVASDHPKAPVNFGEPVKHKYTQPKEDPFVNIAVNSAKSMVGDAISKLTAAVQKEQSPESIYDRLRSSTPGYSYTGKSAEEMANAQFDPAFAMLDQIATQQKGRYNTGSANAKAAYAAYVKELQRTQAENAATYKQAGQEIGTNYDAASGAVTQNTEDSAAALAKELQQLGIQQAAPDLLAKNQGELTKQLGYLSQNRQTAADLNTQTGASTAAYDRGNVNIGRQKGIEYQGDLLANYMDQINTNDQRRLDLQAQQGAAENQYSMQIQQLLQQGNAEREQSINDQFRAMMDNNYRQQQLGIDQRRVDLDFAKLQNQNGSGTGQAGAFQVLADAAQNYGMSPQDAAEVQKTFMNAIRSQPLAKDLGSLLQGIPDSYLDEPFIRSLAYDFFTQYLKSTRG